MTDFVGRILKVITGRLERVIVRAEELERLGDSCHRAGGVADGGAEVLQGGCMEGLIWL